MTIPPIPFDSLYKRSSDLEDKEEAAVDTPLTNTLPQSPISFDKLYGGAPPPRTTANKLMQTVRDTAAVADPVVAAQNPATIELPDPTAVRDQMMIAKPSPNGGLGRVQRIMKERQDYLVSPQKVIDDMAAGQQTIGEAPTGFAKFRQRLANTRVFTNRSLIEFNMGNSSGFHIGTPLAHPVETAKQLITGLPHFFANLVTQPAALLIDQIEPGGYLLPEEKAQYKKEIIVNYGMLLLGPEIGAISKELRVGHGILRSSVAAAEKAGVPVSMAELDVLRRTLPRALHIENNTLQKMITGVHEGAGAGFIGGAMSGSTPEESRNLAAAYAMSALPIGIAFEGVRSVFKPDALGPMASAAVQAQDLFILRQMQASERRSMEKNTSTFYNLATADNLAQAAIRSGRELGNVVIPGVVSPAELNYTHTLGEPDPIIHRRPDGLHDLAFGIPEGIVTKDEPPAGLHRTTPSHAEAMFTVSGHFPNEHVSFLGRDYTYEGPVIGKSGELEGHTLRNGDGTTFEVPWDQVRRGPDALINNYEASPAHVQSALFRDFKRVIRNMGKEDIPDVPFSDMIQRYMAERNMPSHETGPVTKFLGERLAEQLRADHLTPDEQIAYRRMVAESKRYPADMASNLVDAASSNGMYIERLNGGLLVVDSESGEMLGHFKSPEAARAFIETSGQTSGADLTPGGPVPPDAINRGLMAVPPPPNGPHSAPYNFLKDGPLSQLNHWFNTTLLGTRFTGMQQIMKSLDAQLGTQFYARVADPLQQAFKRKYAESRADMNRAAATSKMARGLTTEQLDQVTTSLTTMHPDDMVKKGGLFNRSFTDREIETANWMIENQIDIHKAYKYRQAVEKLTRKYGNQPEVLGDAIKKKQIELNVDEAHVEAAGIIKKLTDLNKPGEVSVDGITLLTQAVQNGDLSPSAYMDANKFTPQMRALRTEIASHFKDLQTRYPIPDQQRLGGYLSRLRNNKENGIVTGPSGEVLFTGDLLKTGELSAHDRDPINLLVRNINYGLNRRFTNAAIKDAKDYVAETTKDMKDGGKFVRELLNKYYIDELRGVPHEESRFAQKMLDGVMDRLGLKTSLDVRRDVVNTALSLGSSAMIGFRPMQGVRDMHNAISIFYTRFGAVRTADMLTLMSRVSAQELVQAGFLKSTTPGEGIGAAFEREGLTANYGPLAVLTPEERLANTISGKTQPIREAIQRTAELGIKWGLQHNVYQWLHAATMLETTTKSLRELNKLANGEYGVGEAAKAKAYNNLFINSYDTPVVKEFDRLVGDGEFKKAAEFLARATSFETVSTFGLANHPAGWGSNTGRIFGQFGNWPVWARTTLARMATRGTIGERTGVAVRFGLTQGSLALASAAFGLNLNSWYLPGSLPLVRGGQSLGEAADSYDEDRTKALQRAAAQVALGVPGSFLFRGGPGFGLLQTAAEVGTGTQQGESEGVRVAKTLPLLGAPGSFLLRDILRGVAMSQNGDNPVSAWLQAFGVPSTEEPSLLNPEGATRPVISDLEF